MTEVVAQGPGRVVRVNDAERVAAQLRQMVVRGELVPGDHIRQEVWAAKFGVSRVPVREALKMLSAEHLLAHHPHRGYYVAEMQATEMEQIYRIRQFLESEILHSIRWPDDEELEQLRLAGECCVAAQAAGDLPETLSEDQRLYFTIYDLSPLTFMVREAKRLWSIADPYRAAAFIRSRIDDPDCERRRARHERLLQALKNHDREEMVNQVLAARSRVVQRLLDDSDPSVLASKGDTDPTSVSAEGCSK